MMKLKVIVLIIIIMSVPPLHPTTPAPLHLHLYPVTAAIRPISSATIVILVTIGMPLLLQLMPPPPPPQQQQQ